MLIAALWLLAGPPPTYAADSELMTSQAMREGLKSENNPNFLFWIGFVAGTAEMGAVFSVICPPAVTYGAEAQMIVNYLDHHSENWNLQPAVNVMTALHEHYPCEK